MKHHAEKELVSKKWQQDMDAMIRCDNPNCRQKVKAYRTNTCPYCGQRLCHICWGQHFHNDYPTR